MIVPQQPLIVDDSRRRLICLALGLSVLSVYGRLAFFDFVFFDDHVYVIEKAEVLAGLSAASIRWAITTTDAGFWHPLTWISLMIDHEVWGLHPGGYHLTNVLLHLIATLILFVALHRLTGALWKSGFVAALFALHPLHVESVAWIAQRKDVLSGLFWMLSLFLYARYVEKPVLGRYGLVLLSFSLGLMAKPMVVTLPIILILLDMWPCRRLSGQLWRRNWKRVVGEKIPFLILGAAAGVVTILAEQQVGALKTLAEFSFMSRLSNAVVAYGFYLYKTVWPFHLSVHYPHPGAWPVWHVVLSLAVLTGVTFLTIRTFRKYPFLLVGWFWYLIGLLPVIGLLQIGSHAFADRYTYIPLIGVFMALAWGADAWTAGRPLRRLPVTAASLMAVIALSLISVQQVGFWRDAETLFRQAVGVTQNNYLAHNNLGAALSRQGRYGEAIGQFTKALALRPDYREARFNMGEALAGEGRYEEALYHYRRVIDLQPEFAEAHNNIAIVYARMGRLDQAVLHFREAIRIRPGYRQAVNNLKIAEEQKIRED
jgi:tetratricopeptide (TPR) repeat protein